MGKDAYEHGRSDGRSGQSSKNIYHPEEEDRESYRDGYDRGSEQKSNSEAND